MEDKHFTIGMAGHIDHGKTALTKALTNIDTDRLKEEKERKISIELGFAPFTLETNPEIHISIIDVPGHERFIRQMIAGVAGIDLVLIIIAADEGIMPQTKEHIHILSLLNIHNAIVVLTKIDKVELDDLARVKEEVDTFLKNTPYHQSPLVMVDSLSGEGIENLKKVISEKLKITTIRNTKAPFRMPIDQVFTISGVGTIVRGTVYEGTLSKDNRFYILPGQKETKARTLQVQSKPVETAFAGQRLAIQLAGLHKNEIKRGDVVVQEPSYFTITNTMDVAMQFLSDIKTPVKQRSPIKLHTGAAEVYGQIVFFDRNEESGGNEVLCQVRLQEEIVVKRGDRFILRRATPMETLGGGWIINPSGEKYKFGEQTIQRLTQLKEGTDEEQIIRFLKDKWANTTNMIKELAMDSEKLQRILAELVNEGKVIELESYYTSQQHYSKLLQKAIKILKSYHQQCSIRQGMNKAEFLKNLIIPKSIQDALISKWGQDNLIKQQNYFIALPNFQPHLPEKWEKSISSILSQLKQDGLNVKPWDEYITVKKIPKKLAKDVKQYLLDKKSIYFITDKMAIHADVIKQKTDLLRKKTGEFFTIKEAKDILQSSRKYVIPFLEFLDSLKITARENDYRKWL
jgi:selenocysteine-specific elongation factor